MRAAPFARGAGLLLVTIDENLHGPDHAQFLMGSTVKPSRIGLTREEFEAEVRTRAAKLGLEGELPADWIANLIRDGLLAGGQRAGNDGKSPVYTYDFRALRRALQLARLRKFGVVDRMEIRVLLFRNGYSLEPSEVREALAFVYKKFGKKLNETSRSGYLDNTRQIGDRHKASIGRDIGPLDPVLKDTGLGLSLDSVIFGLRLARQSALRAGFGIAELNECLRLLADSSDLEEISTLSIRSMAGILQFGDVADDADIIGVISSATDCDLIQAAKISREIAARLAQDIGPLLGAASDDEGLRRADQAISRACRYHPGFAAFSVALCHWLSKLFPEALDILALVEATPRGAIGPLFQASLSSNGW